MPYRVTLDLTAGPLALPGVAGLVGAVYPRHRKDRPGRGAVVELPAVLELLTAVETGQVTAAQARAAFTPFLDQLKEFNQEMDRHLVGYN
ncbi:MULTISPECIES: hypothetical protein [unclassified Streptomyces]|uniref:hypothetical protein n=1 Tax=unclassified Streptomyces TaxID=2593676 RepID=UPI00344F7112